MKPGNFFFRTLFSPGLAFNICNIYMLAFQPVDEALHDCIRSLLDLFGSSLNQDSAIFEHRNPLGNVENIRDLMAYHHACKSKLFLVIGNHSVHRIFSYGIQACCWFVKENNFRFGNQGSREGHPFFHTSGKLRRIFIIDVVEVQLIHFFTNPARNLRLFKRRFFFQGKGDIFENGDGVEQGSALKHVAEFSF